MRTDNVFLCNGYGSATSSATTKTHRLNLHGTQKNISVKFSNVNKSITGLIPAALLDFLEIATYVYCADQLLQNPYKQIRSRRISLHIPVRDINLWNLAPVRQRLPEALNFITHDTYNFTFYSPARPSTGSEYFSSTRGSSTPQMDETVILLDELDSLAGVVALSISQNRKVSIISQHIGKKQLLRQNQNIAEIAKVASQPVAHFPFEISRNGLPLKEVSNRTKTLLLSGAGAIIASANKHSHISIPANGIRNINLSATGYRHSDLVPPPAHPAVLGKIGELLSEILKPGFSINNPFIWHTRADLAKTISQNSCGTIFKRMRGCVNPKPQTASRPLCGACLECIDRRFAILASGNESNEPSRLYARDLLTTERKVSVDYEIAVRYLTTAHMIRHMSLRRFQTQYPEVQDLIDYLKEDPRLLADHAHVLYKKHGDQVYSVISDGYTKLSAGIFRQLYPQSSILILANPYSTQLGKPKSRLPLASPITRPPTPPRPTPAYCRVATRAGVTDCTRQEYGNHRNQVNSFDLFIDGVAGKAYSKDLKGNRTVRDISEGEALILQKCITAQSSIVAHEARDLDYTYHRTANRFFDRAREKVEFPGSADYSIFKSKRGARYLEYEFCPPASFKYCAIIPL